MQAQRKGQQSEASTPTGSPGQSLPGFAPPSADMISLLLLPIAAHQRASNVALPDHPSNTPTQPGVGPTGTHSSPPNPDASSSSNPNQQAGGSLPQGAPTANGNAKRTLAEPPGVDAVVDLDRPYLRVPRGMPVSTLQQHVSGRLQSQHAERAREQIGSAPCSPGSNGLCCVSLSCEGKILLGETLIESIQDRFPSRELLLLEYQQAQS